MRHNWIHKFAFALVALLLISGCYGQPLSTREKGTLAGGVLGGGTGAIIGAAVGHPGAGAAIGGALGAGTGMMIGTLCDVNPEGVPSRKWKSRGAPTRTIRPGPRLPDAGR